MLKINRKAQHIIEYCVLIALVALGIILMRKYVYRSVWAHLKTWEDAANYSINPDDSLTTSVTILFYNRAYPGNPQQCGAFCATCAPVNWYVINDVLVKSPYAGDPCNGDACTARPNLPCLKSLGNTIAVIAKRCDRDTWNNTWGTAGLRECYTHSGIWCLSHVVWAEGGLASWADIFDTIIKNPGGYRQFLLELTVGGSCFSW